jgi:hypothetical protein
MTGYFLAILVRPANRDIPAARTAPDRPKSPCAGMAPYQVQCELKLVLALNSKLD